jgi:hypothetical protein
MRVAYTWLGVVQDETQVTLRTKAFFSQVKRFLPQVKIGGRLRPRSRLAPQRLKRVLLALAENQGDVVALFVRAEVEDFVDDGSEGSCRRKRAVAGQ